MTAEPDPAAPNCPYRAALSATTTGALHPSTLRTFSFSVAQG